MAQARETTFIPPSPNSSSDSCKHESTPDTRLTAFSPDGNSARSNRLLEASSLSASSSPHSVLFHGGVPDGYCAGPETGVKDPFMTGTNASIKTEQKLSPTASSFRPVSAPLVAHGSLNGSPVVKIDAAADLNHAAQRPIDKFSFDLDISRYIVLFSPTASVTIANVEDYLVNLHRLGNPCRGKYHLVQQGTRTLVRLTDVRDARNIHGNIQLGGPEWRAEYISPAVFYQVANPGSVAEQGSEGLIYAMGLPLPGFLIATSEVEIMVHDFLQTEGDIFAFQRRQAFRDGGFTAFIEFSDSDVAVGVASKYNGFVLNASIFGVQMLLTLFNPDAPTSIPEPLRSPNPSLRSPIQDVTDTMRSLTVSKVAQPNPLLTPARHLQSPVGGHVQPPQVAMYPIIYQGQYPGPARYLLDHTPTRGQGLASLSTSMPIMGSVCTPPASPSSPMTVHGHGHGHGHGDYGSPRPMHSYGRQDARRHSAMRMSRSPYYNAAGHHNHVDVNRIRGGIDVRTTIMLRNIPNKVDQAMLKRIVDESSWGKYDFMYLRIDFANDCNVGYAFINFVDPLDIIDFVNTRGNQRWNCFKSDKVAEISYATIQGKDCLVQKFRNSSVMLEAPHYRPKLYYTINGPHPDKAGEEEEFPEPDNQSKMKRSCENAEHVGLFTPNAGQHFRDEQRRRRSQYDRGTRLAALEEYDFESHMQQPVLFNS
ncbi:RNA recognition motif 2-domain-containing protein [Diplogelasinospora grovesii]|uniref:RNA recognition motif 2-domain-containing protein n=1 Tax=Diplogelasinospora grovesii TaxID=303347 RepID=A0AAN6S4A9_9PEZI|nr:RNA recognition motif 2-domain-containing protein [Diplogelasinospora grovesii]